MTARRLAGACVVASILSTAAVRADCEPVGEGARRVADGEHVVTFVTDPRNIAIGEHFAVRVGACRDGRPYTGAISVDADMPAHGHGMNYSPGIVSAGEGRVRAEGLMFHMPGEWRVRFILDGASGRKILEATVDAR